MLTGLFLHKLQCRKHMGIYEGFLVRGIDSSGLLRVIGSMDKVYFLSIRKVPALLTRQNQSSAKSVEEEGTLCSKKQDIVSIKLFSSFS